METRNLVGLYALLACNCGAELDLPVPPDPVSTVAAVTAEMSPEIAQLASGRWLGTVKPILDLRDFIDRLDASNEKFETTGELDREFSLRDWGVSGSAHLEFKTACSDGSISFNLLFSDNALDPRIWGIFENCPSHGVFGTWAFATQKVDLKTLDLNHIAASVTFAEKDRAANFYFQIAGDVVKAPLFGEFGVAEVIYDQGGDFEIVDIDGSWHCIRDSRVCLNDSQDEISW